MEVFDSTIFSSICTTAALTPAATEAKRLAPLLPTVRTVEVLQFCSWS